MSLYTHEMRWIGIEGNLGGIEYYYVAATKTLYTRNGIPVHNDFDIEHFKRIEVERKVSCWSVLEINVELENK